MGICSLFSCCFNIEHSPPSSPLRHSPFKQGQPPVMEGVDISPPHEPRPKGRGMIWEEFRTPPKFGCELPGPKGPGFRRPHEGFSRRRESSPHLPSSTDHSSSDLGASRRDSIEEERRVRPEAPLYDSDDEGGGRFCSICPRKSSEELAEKKSAPIITEKESILEFIRKRNEEARREKSEKKRMEFEQKCLEHLVGQEKGKGWGLHRRVVTDRSLCDGHKTKAVVANRAVFSKG
ncbi:MAG: hypothetical protein KGJ02_06615 [Verrucomicrobiota bacterium]|nr:hypothetical protein [Verrucomicrobiota bacterium]